MTQYRFEDVRTLYDVLPKGLELSCNKNKILFLFKKELNNEFKLMDHVLAKEKLREKVHINGSNILKYFFHSQKVNGKII